MKVRTQDQLIRIMDEDRIWRVKEISLLKAQFDNKSLGSQLNASIRRSFIPLAYAHWEGYVKKIGQAYLDYVAVQRMTLSEMNPCFQSLYLSIEFQDDLRNIRRHFLQGVLSKLKEGKDARVHIKTNDVITAKGNLNSESLLDICKNLGFDYNRFAEHLSFIDKILLARRNAVAHGEYVQIDPLMADEVRKKVIECIDIFKCLVSDALVNKKYRA